MDTLAELARLAGVLRDRGALVGASDHGTTKSLYAVDPDGLEFEVCWVLPASALDDTMVEELRRSPRIAPLDLDAEIARYGATTRGGVGVSIPS